MEHLFPDDPGQITGWFFWKIDRILVINGAGHPRGVQMLAWEHGSY